MIGTPLDLKQNVVLERFQFNVQLFAFSRGVPEWIHQTLRTITSHLFSELTFGILNAMYSSYPCPPENGDGWDAVDTLFDAMAERNPDFRVVFRGEGFHSMRGDCDGVPKFPESYLPIVSSKGLVKFEHMADAEFRIRKLGFQ